MPTYSSVARQTAYDALLKQRKGRRISAEKYQKEKAKIDRREEKAVLYKEEQRFIRALLAEDKREAKKAETRRRNQEKKEQVRIPQNLLVFKIVAGDQEETCRQLWKHSVNSTARFISDDIDITLDVAPSDKGYKEFRKRFYVYESGELKWRYEPGDTIIVVKPTTIEARKLTQRFRDGITHCVFTPLLAKLTSRLEGASPATKKRVSQRIKKMTMLKVMYAEGVPENKMEEVARACGIKIHLYDVLGNDIAVYNENGREGCVKMTNTRENHVDIGMVVDSDPCELSQDEMISIWRDIKKSGDFYMIDGDLKEGQPSKIRTLNGAWAVEDPIRKACSDFDKELGIINYKVNALKHPELNEFLKTGRIINAWSCSLGAEDATACADMPSAYAQFKKCHLYSGFLGHIHQFRSGSFDRAFVEKNLGYYNVKVIGGVSNLMRTLGISEGKEIVLFSPELIYYMNDGLQVEIFEGAWGSRFDFDFTPEMLVDRRYCFWAGRLGIERHETSHTISASEDWASHLASDHKVFYWKQEGLLTIKKPVKQCFTAHHILGALTSYVRIQMVEAIKLFKPENLVRVVLDGIYYKGEKPAGLEWFSDKKAKTTSNDSMPWYVGEYSYGEEKTTYPPMGRIVGHSLLTGQGGSGKTYSVFTDKGFNNLLYVSPSHILGQDVKKKYGAKYTTIHKLIGIDCQPYYLDHRIPSVIFVDEITQIDASWIDKVFEMYPQSLILLAGDIDNEGRWFQCRSGSGEEWNTIWKPTNVNVIEFLEDRRSRDDELKALKLRIRNAMKKCDLDYASEVQMEMWAKKYLPISEFNFQPGDTCIAGTHRTNAKILEKGVVSGYYKKGGYVSDVELPNYEKRGSFSVHSYQGKTIEKGNIWIFLDDLFEYAMLYTAVSRAVSIDQIKFIRKL